MEGAVSVAEPGSPDPSHDYFQEGFPDGTVVKDLPAHAGDVRDAGLIPGFGNLFQYSCLRNSIDSESHGVAQSWAQLKQLSYKHTNMAALVWAAIAEHHAWGGW